MNPVQAPPAAIALFLLATALLWGGALWGGVPRLGGGRVQDWPLRLFLATTGTVIVVGWAATTLALVGLYSLASLAVVLLGCAVLLGWAAKVHPPAGRCSRGGWHEVALAALMVLGAFFYLQPHEYLLGGSDAGSYINTAAATARTGTYLQRNEWNRFLASHAAVTLRQQPDQLLPRHLQLVGWYFDDTDPALVRPQFFPFHPVLLSVAMGVGGVAAGFWVVPAAAVLGLAALYFLARQLFGRSVALTATALLTLTSTQIFFGRYPTTEPLTMLLLLTSFLALQVVWDEDRQAAPGWGVLGGAALGAALLTRIDLPIVLGAVGGVLVLRGWQGRWSPAWGALAWTLAIFVLQLLWVVWAFTWPYFWNTYASAFGLVRRAPWLVGGLVGVGAVSLAVAFLGGPRRLHRAVERCQGSASVRWTLAALIVLLSLYAYFLRPLLEPARLSVSWPAGNSFPILNGQNWVRLGWYLTPLGLGLATGGLAMLVLREQLTRLALVLGIGVATTLLYVYNILNTPYHIYTMRRYVPVAIPMLWIFAAYLLVNLSVQRKPALAAALRWGGILLLAGGLLYQARYVLPARDYAGAWPQLQQLQQLLDPQAVVVIAEPAEALFADAFGAPLGAIFGHPVATVRSSAADDASLQDQTAEFLEELLAFAMSQGRPLQLLAVEPIPPLVREQLELQPAASFAFTTQMLMNTFTEFPAVTQRVHYGIELYNVVAPGTEEARQRTVEVDVGALDAAYLDDGFYAKEYIPGAPTMRWTQGTAALTLPLPRQTPAARQTVLQVRAMIYRPAAVEPAPVWVSLDGEPIGRFVPNEAWNTFAFVVPDAIISATDSVEIRFTTDPFVPAELGVNNDARQLGFLLDWVHWTPAPP